LKEQNTLRGAAEKYLVKVAHKNKLHEKYLSSFSSPSFIQNLTKIHKFVVE
jgi:hypothetical protein